MNLDFNYLTTDELITIAQFYGFLVNGTLPLNWPDLFSRINLNPGTNVPLEIADLYLATNFNKTMNWVPKVVEPNQLSAKDYDELYHLFYLPGQFTMKNKERLSRIIKKMAQQQTSNIKYKIQIMPLIYKGPNRIGDFSWMIQRPEYKDVLFLFNDNQEQFIAFINRNPGACSAGNGNAAIRPYQCSKFPRAAGIPTGSLGVGYQTLEQANPFIDDAILYIRRLLKTGRYKKIAYSADADGRSLGVSIYSPVDSVKEYIVNQIEELKLI